LQLTTIDFNKTGLIDLAVILFLSFVLRKRSWKKCGRLKDLKALQPKKWEGSSLAAL